MNEYLDKSTESKLISIGNKKYYRTAMLTIGYIALVIVFWLFFMIFFNRSFELIINYIPLFICILPFFPFLVHKTLFSKTFYATVNYTVNSTQFQQLKEAYVRERPETVDVLEIKFKKDDGKEFAIIYRKKNDITNGIHYESGDRVLFVRGLKYPFKFPINNTAERTCSICGRTVDIKSMTCKRCKFDYSELLK